MAWKRSSVRSRPGPPITSSAKSELPPGAQCSSPATSGNVTITTSSSTPKGTCQITVVFTETLPGAAAAGMLLPFLPLPVFYFRRWFARRGWMIAGIALAASLAAISATGCGGGGGSIISPPPQTHQVTSSAGVTLVVRSHRAVALLANADFGELRTRFSPFLQERSAACEARFL